MSLFLVSFILLSSPHAPENTVTVFAAASLKDGFKNIARLYETSHPRVHIILNFAGSQALATQIRQGAPADVFASASMKNLAQTNPSVGSIRIFACNRLTVVCRRSLLGIHTLQDLQFAPKIVLADETVPAGKYASQFLSSAAKKFGTGWLNSVRSHVVSKELDVRSVLGKVKLGVADVGIVYSSDAVSARGNVTVIQIPDSLNEIAQYPVAPIPHCPNPSGAKDFVSFLFTKTAQAELRNQGFLPPPSFQSDLNRIQNHRN